ncbi:hypothetical protein BC834DRAFT_252455 [Gloeopeniophorella convolvens]|nr:hypothetical protein BC834DRAFT_252455 [Gloeopeniophorella convolvens]
MECVRVAGKGAGRGERFHAIHVRSPLASPWQLINPADVTEKLQACLRAGASSGYGSLFVRWLLVAVSLLPGYYSALLVRVCVCTTASLTHRIIGVLCFSNGLLLLVIYISRAQSDSGLVIVTYENRVVWRFELWARRRADVAGWSMDVDDLVWATRCPLQSAQRDVGDVGSDGAILSYIVGAIWAFIAAYGVR